VQLAQDDQRLPPRTAGLADAGSGALRVAQMHQRLALAETVAEVTVQLCGAEAALGSLIMQFVGLGDVEPAIAYLGAYGRVWRAGGTGLAPCGSGRMPAGKFVVLGDNPARSFDSRQLGS
jgi:hypothetical protein